PELLLQNARLREASGRPAEARALYERALERVEDPEEREEVQLRLTFLASDARNVDALVALARSRDREFRNRAAVALAILNHPGEAAELYEVFGDDEQQHRQHL